jgi:hypothetical protein
MEKPSCKISFCTTCKQRLWQLRHTFPPNLEAVREDGGAEIVLVNYNSRDGLEDWVRQYQSDIDAGILRYVRERTEPYFHCSKAKNLAHFAATGDFVVNLDADNFIGDTISTFRGVWLEHSDAVIQGFCGDYTDGTYGRIGMAKRHFLSLGGYDEETLPVGHQDRDLIKRATAFGLRFHRLQQSGIAAIKNNSYEKMRYAGSKYSYGQMAKKNSARLEESIRNGRLVANRDRKPVKVFLNFAVDLEL